MVYIGCGIKITARATDGCLDAIPRELLRYQTAAENVPFSEWMDSIERRHLDVYATVLNRLDRVEDGNFGGCKDLDDGVWELKIDIGPGYRVYYGKDGDLVVLLLGGTKKTQKRDIKTAKSYWTDYNA